MRRGDTRKMLVDASILCLLPMNTHWIGKQNLDRSNGDPDPLSSDQGRQKQHAKVNVHETSTHYRCR